MSDIKVISSQFIKYISEINHYEDTPYIQSLVKGISNLTKSSQIAIEAISYQPVCVSIFFKLLNLNSPMIPYLISIIAQISDHYPDFVRKEEHEFPRLLG